MHWTLIYYISKMLCSGLYLKFDFIFSKSWISFIIESCGINFFKDNILNVKRQMKTREEIWLDVTHLFCLVSRGGSSHVSTNDSLHCWLEERVSILYHFSSPFSFYLHMKIYLTNCSCIFYFTSWVNFRSFPNIVLVSSNGTVVWL